MEEVKKEKNKFPKKFVIIFLILVAIASLIIVAFVFVLPKNKDNNNESKNLNDRLFLAQVAIFNKEFSVNYNGEYEFDYVNFVELKDFSNKQINAIYNYYNVSSTMELIATLSNKFKSDATTNGEVLVILNGTFCLNHNGNIYEYGNIYGNDDYSILQNKSGIEIASLSLSKLNKTDFASKTSLDNSSYNENDNSLFVKQKVSLIINSETYEFFITKVYKIKNINK